MAENTMLKKYNFTDLPIVGTTAKVNPVDATKTVPGQDIKLGGYSGLRYEGLVLTVVDSIRSMMPQAKSAISILGMLAMLKPRLRGQ